MRARDIGLVPMKSVCEESSEWGKLRFEEMVEVKAQIDDKSRLLGMWFQTISAKDWKICVMCSHNAYERKNNLLLHIRVHIFQFDNLIFTQLCDIAIGTKAAQALATIHVHTWYPWLPYTYMYTWEIWRKIFLNNQTLNPHGGKHTTMFS